MKTLKFSILIISVVLFTSCSKNEARGRFNYPFIKSKLELTKEQVNTFDNITNLYTSKAKQAWMDSNGDIEKAKEAQKIIFKEQDLKLKEILNKSQYKTYITEVTIERSGREQHNMNLIKSELSLDSIQNAKFDLINEAFYTTLIENHDNYHGKPKVYEQYYKEIDLNRKEAFKGLMTDDQYTKYLELLKNFEFGKSED